MRNKCNDRHYIPLRDSLFIYFMIETSCESSLFFINIFVQCPKRASHVVGTHSQYVKSVSIAASGQTKHSLITVGWMFCFLLGKTHWETTSICCTDEVLIYHMQIQSKSRQIGFIIIYIPTHI